MRVALKICGVTRAADVDACAALGVDAIGLNLWTGSRRGLSIVEARSLCEAWPASGPEKVGVFVDPSPDVVREAIAALGLDLVQMHGDAPIERYQGLGAPVIQVIRGTPELGALPLASPPPARLLLDAAVPGFGGAGVRTDWAWVRRVVEHLPGVPVWLAGGITVDNAASAIAEARPAGLDVASGSEQEGARRGEKDPAKIAALVDICRRFGL